MKSYVYQAIITSDEEGGYDVEFPDLPGCFTYGDTLQEAGEMAMDAAATYVGALVKDGLAVPDPTYREADTGEMPMLVAFSTDESCIAEGEKWTQAPRRREIANQLSEKIKKQAGLK